MKSWWSRAVSNVVSWSICSSTSTGFGPLLTRQPSQGQWNTLTEVPTYYAESPSGLQEGPCLRCSYGSEYGLPTALAQIRACKETLPRFPSLWLNKRNTFPRRPEKGRGTIRLSSDSKMPWDLTALAPLTFGRVFLARESSSTLTFSCTQNGDLTSTSHNNSEKIHWDGVGNPLKTVSASSDRKAFRLVEELCVDQGQSLFLDLSFSWPSYRHATVARNVLSMLSHFRISY